MNLNKLRQDLSVPPIFTDVYAGDTAVVINGEDGKEVPICSVIVPPLLPVKITSGTLSIETSVPGFARISKLAAP